MNNPSPSSSPSFFKLLTSALLSYTLLMTPLASVAAANVRRGVPAGRAATAKAAAESPALPAPAPAPEAGRAAEPLAAAPQPAPLAPPGGAVTATMTAAVSPSDGDGGKIDPTTGVPATTEKITYTAALGNSSVSDATGLTFSVQLDTHTSLVAGSLNSTPVAFDVAVTTNEDTGVNITLAGQDPDGNNLTFTNIGSPAHGSLGSWSAPACNATGVCTTTATYTPAADYFGTDGFTFKTTDNYTTPAASNEAGTVSITVNGVNDAPTFTVPGNPAASNEDAGSQTVTDFITNIRPAQVGNTTEDTQTVSFEITNYTNAGLFSTPPSFVITGAGYPKKANLSYTAAPNQNGTSTVTYRLRDNGCPGSPGTPCPNGGVDVTSDQTFTITVNAVNDKPTVVAPTGIVVQANMKRIGLGGLLANVSDVDSGVNGCVATPFTVKSGSISATAPVGGTVSNVNLSAGTFEFDPPPGFTGGNVTFTYVVTDNGCPGTADSDPVTVTIAVQGPVIWFVNPALASDGDGRLSNPFKLLQSATVKLNNLAANQRIFVYTGTTEVMAIPAGQQGTPNTVTLSGSGTQAAAHWLIGQGALGSDFDTLMGLTGGLAVPANTIARPSINGTRPTIRSTISMKDNTVLRGADVNVTTAAAGAKGVTNGAIGGTSTIEISDVDVTSAAGNAVDFSSAQTVNYTGTNNDITSGTGIALNVSSTTIGASNFNFKSITAGTAASGPSSGIVLNSTGAVGSLIVGGGGNASQGGDASGGTIQKTTSHGISLTSTKSPSFNNIKVLNTGGSGIDGASVTNFTLTNSNLTGNGTFAVTDSSNVAFNDASVGVTGTVTITNNILNTAAYHGVDILNNSGTVDDANISNNLIVSGTTTGTGGTSFGSGIRLIGFGTAGGAAQITKATINANNIQNFPASAGILVQGGNANSTGAPATTMGTAGHATNKINITNNLIKGNSPANRVGTNAIQASVNGRGQGNFNISNNGTVANPITNISGNVISHSSLGFANVTTTIANNVIVANHTAGVGGALGISVGVGRTFAVTDSASLTVSITGNTVSQTDANGILARAVEGQSTMNITVKNNNVAAPLAGVRPGIRVDSGTSEAGTNANVCLDMSGNTSAGSGGSQGLGLRKQGTSTSVHIYGVKGMSATATPNVEAYVNGLNPAGNGTLLISATSGFSNCATSPDALPSSSAAPLTSADSAPRTQQQSQSSGRSAEQIRALADEDPVRPPDREMLVQSPADGGPISRSKFNYPALQFDVPATTTPEADSAAVEAAPAQPEAAQVETAQAAAPARVWSDMPAGSESAAAATRDDDSAQDGASIVNASYERPASKRARADAPVGDAVATAAAATAATESSPEAGDNGAAIYARMAHSLLLATFFSVETVNVSGVGGAGFILPVGRTVTVTFQATLNNPPNFTSYSAAPPVLAQGTLFGAFDNNPLDTDDPSVGVSIPPDKTVVIADLFNTTSTITGASPSNTTNTGQPVTFTASIAPNNTPAPAGGTLPGGTAVFKDNGAIISGCGAVTVTSGAAQCTTSALTTGTHNNITVEYGGDGNFDPSTSAAFAQTVTQSGTTTVVTSSLNPSLVTQSVTFKAEVTSNGAVTPPTGSVKFHQGATDYGTVALTSGGACPAGKGCASVTVSTLAAGLGQTITGDYLPDAAFTLSSGSVSQNVNKSGTSTTLSSAPNPSTPTQNVTFTAVVTSATAVAPPTGTVDFIDDTTAATICDDVAKSGGQWTCQTSTLTTTTHSVKAVYNEDATWSTSTSNTVSQVIAQNGTSTALVSSKNPSTPTEAVTFTATVTSSTGTPTGNVAFKDAGADITGCASQPLNGSGVATCVVPSGTFVDGTTHPITAVYAGNATFSGSTSNIVSQVVSACTATTVVTKIADDGSAGSLRAAIGGVCEGGNVTFSNDTSGGATNFYDGAAHTISLADAGGELLISKSLTITGPGAKVLTVKRDASATTDFRVFKVSNATTTGPAAGISGMTVSNGKASGATPADLGGAIYNDHGALTLTGVAASGNSAANGGAVYNDGRTAGSASLTVANSTFSGNTATGAGGAVYSSGTGGGAATLTMTNSTVSGNTAATNGGGIFNDAGTGVLTSVTVTGNRSTSTAAASSGGIRVESGTVTLKNSIVAGNYKGNAVGTKQVETVTVSGTANVNGSITVRVTAAGMGGSPKNVSVAVANGDTASTVADSIVTALANDANVGGFFDVSKANTADVVLTVKTAAANDPTIHVKIFGNSTGIQNADSTHTLAGVAPVTGVKQVETLKLSGTVADCAPDPGTATLTVTADGLNGGLPVTASVDVANNQTASTVADTIRTFLGGADPQAQTIAGYFDIDPVGSVPDVIFTKKTAAADENITVSLSLDNLCTGITSTSENTTTGVAPVTGVKQQETVTVAGGPVANAGTIQVLVTANGLTGSPKTVPVLVAAGDTNDAVAIKIVTALTGDTDINNFFTVTNSGADVILTAKTAAANDGTMNVKIFGNATGIANADSAPTTPGVVQVASDIGGAVNTAGGASSFNLIGDAATSGGLTDGSANNIVGNGGSGTRDTSTVLNTTLADNGGQTQTHALANSSPALDAGNSVLTTLGADITDTTSPATITVADASSIPAGVGFVIRIDGEQMTVTAKPTSTTLTVTRGANGTTAATHTSGANVYSLYSTTDQRGYTRPVNFDGNPPAAGDDSDIGAVESQVQPGAPNAPVLDPSSDTGALDGHITSDTSPTFNISGVVPGAFVELLRDTDPASTEVVAVSGIASGTTITLTDPGPLGVGNYTYRAQQTVGGAATSNKSGTLSITIDNTAPPKPSSPVLDTNSDSGTKLDNVTNDTSPTFNISNLVAGNLVELLRNGTPVASKTAAGTTDALTDPGPLAHGVTYSYTARQTNGVGNSASSDPPATPLTIDTAAPGAPSTPDLQAGSDSGSSSTDDRTKTTPRAFDIAGTETGSTVELLRDTVPASGVVVVTSGTGNGSTLTLSDTSGVLADGTYVYSSRQTDAAGNASATSAGLPVTLDTTVSAATPDLQAGSDSGSSSTDDRTKTTPRAFDIAGTETGSTVELLRDDDGPGPNAPVVVTSGTGNGGVLPLSDANGALADGTYYYSSRQTDVAGNVATSSALPVTMDTAATANAPDLDAASDTGASDTDNRTSAATPHVFNITIAEAGSKVELLRDGTAVANLTGSGAVQLNDTDVLTDGTYQYSTRETDVAGNVATSSNLAVTIDTTAPTVSSVTRVNASPTSAASVDFTVTFSEPVTGVDAADFATTTSGGITGASVSNVTGSGATYTVTVSTGSGDGTIRLDVTDDDTILDVMNLKLGGNGPGNGNFTTGAVYIVDRSNPTVSSINRAGGNPTGAASVTFTVTFSEAVSGVDTGDFSVVATGSVAGALVSGVLPASGPSQTYTVTVSTGSGTPGTLGLNLVDDDSILDVVGKELGGAGGGNGNFTGQVYNIDKTAPNTTVVYAGVDNPAHGPTSSTVVNFTVTFTKPVTGFDNSDITLGGTAGATVANVSETAPNDGTTYNVGVEGMTTSGTITVAVPANAATDDAGNGNNASGTASVDFVPDNFSAFVVTTTADPGDGTCDPAGTGDGCTLREAIAAADADFGAETITFDATVFAAPGPYTINLGSALPDISSSVTIDGPGANVLTVKRDTGGNYRVFAIASGNYDVTLEGLTISNGNDPGGSGKGGGINNGSTGTVNVTNCTISGNSAGLQGGGLSNEGAGTLNVTGSTFSGNSAAQGGGLYLNFGTVSITNSTVSGNTATGVGGGLVSNNATTTISNSTVTDNRADSDNNGTGVGGGVLQSSAPVTLRSTIVAGNFNEDGATDAADDISGTVVAASSFNLIGTGGAGGLTNGTNSNQVGVADAALRPLALNGAATQTHSLQCTSPAIDKGSAFGQTTDQRGLTRIFDLADTVFPNAAGGDGTDIGALETQSGGGCLPAAVAPAPSTNEDTQTGDITLKGTYSQSSPDLIFSITQTPAHGSLTPLSTPVCVYESGDALNTCTAKLKYTPSLNFNGLDTFKFKVSTGSLDSESADVNVTVNPVNDAPVATPNSATTDEDVPVSVTLLGSDVEGSSLSFTVVTNPAHGALSGTAPNLTYTPDPNYYNNPLNPPNPPADSFTFKVNDGALDSATSTIAITVNAVNDAPVAVNDTYNASENTPLSVAAALGVIKNDTDVENQTLTAVLFASPTHAASFTFNANGSFSYTPQANFVGDDTFTYRADDSSSLNNLSNLATVTIKVNAGGLFQFSAATFSEAENTGAATVTVTRTGGSSGAASVNYATAAGGTATGAAACGAGVDFVNASGTLNWADGDTASKTFAVTLCNDSLFELDKTVNLALSGVGGSGELGTQTTAVLTITDGDAPGGVFGFGQPLYTVGERDGFATVTVTRTGDTTRAANVDYTTDDGADPHVPVPCSATAGAALERCDYTASFGTLRFAANETSKTFVVLVTDDSYTEGSETTALKLTNPTDGGALALDGTAVSSLQIADDVPESATNRNDDDASFVTEHYHDFLGRQPDASGLAFWTQGITSCGADQGCRQVKRINTSAAFFLSIEFQNTGFYAYRVHKAAMGDEQGTFTDAQGTHQVPVPAIRLRQFLRDSRAVGQDVVVGVGNWQAQIEANKRALALEVVQRPGFMARYPAQTGATAFVASLDSNTGGVLTDAQRSNLISQLSVDPTNPNLRAEVLRTVAETEPFQLAEKNRAFVLMQYYGYLRRNPNDAPEAGLDYSGYVYWLNKLNQFNGNFISAEMVKAFLESTEYRQRFGQ